MTIGTIDPRDEDIPETFVDVDDDGYFYIKQDDEWISLPLASLPALIDILKTIRVC